MAKRLLQAVRAIAIPLAGSVLIGGCLAPNTDTPSVELRTYVTQREPEIKAASSVVTGAILLGVSQANRELIAKETSAIAAAVEESLRSGELQNRDVESQVLSLVRRVEPAYRDQVAFVFVSLRDVIDTQIQPLDQIDQASREAAIRRLLIAAAQGVRQGTRAYAASPTTFPQEK